MKTLTISSIYVQSLMEGYVLKGNNPKALLRPLGIPEQIVHNSRLRISILDFIRLSERTMTTLHDETCALLETPLPLGSLEAIIRTGFSCSTIGDALVQCNNTLNLITGSIQTNFVDDGEFVCMSYQTRPRKGVVGDYALEQTLLLCQRTMCWLAGNYIPLTKVHLQHPQPSHYREYKFVFYGAPVFFNQSENAIFFRKKDLIQPVAQNRKDLEDLCKNIQVNLLTLPRRSSSVSVQLRIWMEKGITNGTTSFQLPEAAKYFRVTEQTLRRKLSKEGCSFRQMKEDARRDMAIFLLKSGKHSVESISEILGFSEASAFIRAFKHWTGMTPLTYQKL
ncbi:MAG: AraC family transcriptional regulator [Candidatus Thiodiazotropha sp.]